MCYPLGTGLAFNALSIEEHLFASEAYLALQGKEAFTIKPPPTFGAGRLYGFQHGTGLATQFKSPFAQGRFEQMGHIGLVEVLKEAMDTLGAQDAVLQLPPMLPGLASWHNWADADSPLKVIACTANYHLLLSSMPFIDQLPADQRRVLRRQFAAGWQTRLVFANELPLVYGVLATNRASKGYPMPLTLTELQHAFKALPEHYRAYAVTTPADLMVGAAVVVKVTGQVWYTFMLGHIWAGPGASPILSLLAQIWADAQNAGVAVLDLGTAGLPGQEHPGLAAFKQSLGAVQTPKITVKLCRN